MARGSDVVVLPPWLCVVQRSSYFLTHHAVKWSLLVVSVERFVAVKYPYLYCRYVRRQVSPATLALRFFIAYCFQHSAVEQVRCRNDNFATQLLVAKAELH